MLLEPQARDLLRKVSSEEPLQRLVEWNHLWRAEFCVQTQTSVDVGNLGKTQEGAHIRGIGWTHVLIDTVS